MASILIIEDDRDIRNVTELILAEAGHHVISANDGLTGVAVAAQVQPQLILMDLAMPVLDGWRATQHLKANPATKHIPIIAFTALVDTSGAKQAMLYGCEALIVKPFDLTMLLDVIASVLANHAGSEGSDAQEIGGIQ